jgi:hypothetical protein
MAWLYSPAAVFLAGAVMAAVSLLLSRMVPRDPAEGNEVMRPLGFPSRAGFSELSP